MRILLTADPMVAVPPRLYGGIERVVASLIKEFRLRGHCVGLVAHRDSAAEVDAFYPWPGSSPRLLRDSVKNTFTLWSAARQFQPDVLHSFSRIAYLTPLLPGALPKLMSYQREPSSWTTAWGLRLSGGKLRFSGCSEQLAAAGRQAGGLWQAIPNFIDPQQFTFCGAVAQDAPLVFLSRLEPIKGCHTAIAIARASGRRLLIAGNRVEEGSAAGYFEREIAPHLGKDGIEYVGAVDDQQKDRLLGQAAAMVVPIEWEEPFGIVFAEALACGTPVISCARGALPEIVEPGKHGFLIGSVEEGVAAVQSLPRISRLDCRARVEEHFTVQRVADRYWQLYEAMIIGAGGKR